LKPLHLLPLAALALSAAHAGLPLSTEDAEVLAPRDCEFEAGALSLHEPAINSQEQVLNLSCGVGANTQLGLATGRLKAGDERSQQLALGGKFSFWQGDDGAGAAFAAALRSLAGSVDLRRAIGVTNRSKAESYFIERCAEQYEAILERAVARCSGR